MAVNYALLFTAYLREFKLPAPEAEHRFCPSRMWRFDYAWPGHMIALEVEGGVWTGGRHSRGGTGFVKDMEKYNEAAALGWRVLRVQPKELLSKKTIDLLQRGLQKGVW